MQIRLGQRSRVAAYRFLPGPGRSSRSRSGHNVLQVGVSVGLLTLLALLLANICIIELARNFNERVCIIAAQAGAQAAQQGGNESEVAQVVRHTILDATADGYFLMYPSRQEVHFDSIHGLPCLLVVTVTGARLPAPLLVFNGTFGQDGRMLFYKTCVVSLKPAQKVETPSLVN